jgi:hypothetical protein
MSRARSSLLEAAEGDQVSEVIKPSLSIRELAGNVTNERGNSNPERGGVKEAGKREFLTG